MVDVDSEQNTGLARLPLVASLIALVGLIDSVYLTIKHLTAEPVPCSIIEGCEQVLSSPYAEVAGVPLATLGAAAYFAAFSAAILAAFGERLAWRAFGILSVAMAAFSIWLLYLQGMVIGAFCQFCLLSAATSIALFVITAISFLTSRRT